MPPNAPRSSQSSRALLSIDKGCREKLTGTLYSEFYDRTVRFGNEIELISAMESLFDGLSFPQQFMEPRRFYTGGGRKRIRRLRNGKGEREDMKDKDTKATFVVHVQFRRNATWQGTIQWVDGQRTQRFRSALEMLKLIDEAMGDEGTGDIRWDEET